MRSLLFTILFVTYGLAHECHIKNNCECHPICLNTNITICYDDYIYLKNHGKIERSVYIVGKGDCSENYKQECICCSDQTHIPVCGTDNRVYLNLCELRCVADTNYGKINNLDFAHFGYCRSEHE